MIRASAALLIALASVSLALGADHEVGGLVFPAAAKVPVRNDAGATIGTWTVTPGKVLRVAGDWVEVRHSQGTAAHRGWVTKAEVVRAADAPAFYTDYLKANPKGLWAYQNRSAAWAIRGDHDNAVKDLTEAIKVYPAAPLYCDRGLAWQRKGNLDQAIGDYTEAVRLDPKNATAFNNRGIARHHKREYEPAVADFSEAIRLTGGRYTQAYYNRALARGAIGPCPQTVRDYEEALRLDPNHVGSLTGLAWVLSACPSARLRDGERACELASRACELSGWKEPGAVAALGAAWAECGDFDRAAEYQVRALADRGYAEQHGQAARARLMFYEAKQPYYLATAQK
jgi:tetratricopeptide (TPR) repeat protein